VTRLNWIDDLTFSSKDAQAMARKLFVPHELKLSDLDVTLTVEIPNGGMGFAPTKILPSQWFSVISQMLTKKGANFKIFVGF
jgi:hypothetical protein